MLDLALHVSDAPAGVTLVPRAVELFGRGPQLHNEVAGQVFRIGFTAFLTPELDQGRFVTTHNDPGVGPTDEGPPMQSPGKFGMLHFSAYYLFHIISYVNNNYREVKQFKVN